MQVLLGNLEGDQTAVLLVCQSTDWGRATQWTRPSLVRIIACRLFDNKPLFQPMVSCPSRVRITATKGPPIIITVIIHSQVDILINYLIDARPRKGRTHKDSIEIVLTSSSVRFKVAGLNTLRPRQNGRHFADDILKCIFLNENVWIPIEISLKFVPKGLIDNIPALV